MGANSLASTLSAALSPSMGLNSLHASLSPQSPMLIQSLQNKVRSGWGYGMLASLGITVTNNSLEGDDVSDKDANRLRSFSFLTILICKNEMRK